MSISSSCVLRFSTVHGSSEGAVQSRRSGATLRGVSESAFRQIVGQSTLDDVSWRDRPHITQRTKELIQRTLDFYNAGITVTSVNLTDVQFRCGDSSQRDANKRRRSGALREEAQAYANGRAARGAGRRLAPAAGSAATTRKLWRSPKGGRRASRSLPRPMRRRPT